VRVTAQVTVGALDDGNRAVLAMNKGTSIDDHDRALSTLASAGIDPVSSSFVGSTCREVCPHPALSG
jgi:hypothetical protein